MNFAPPDSIITSPVTGARWREVPAPVVPLGLLVAFPKTITSPITGSRLVRSWTEDYTPPRRVLLSKTDRRDA